MVAAWPELCATHFVCGSADLGYTMMFTQGPQGFGVGYANDFSDESQGMPQKKKPRREAPSGEPRPWLRVYETCPAQLLNAYGMSKVVMMPDDKVWDALTRPLATGATCGTELASKVSSTSSSSKFIIFIMSIITIIITILIIVILGYAILL